MTVDDYIRIYENVRNSCGEGYFSNLAMQFSKLGNKDIPNVSNIQFLKRDEVFQENGGTIQYMGTTVNFTQYKSGYIYFHEVQSNAIAISYDFSGCAMAKVMMSNGRAYVFHIFLNDNSRDCRRYWNSFVRNGIISGIISDIVLFKPFEPFKLNLRSTREFAIGIVDSNNQCISIKMEKAQYANGYRFMYCGRYLFNNNSNIKLRKMYEAVIY